MNTGKSDSSIRSYLCLLPKEVTMFLYQIQLVQVFWDILGTHHYFKIM